MCDICVNELTNEERGSLPPMTRILHGLPVQGVEYKTVPWMYQKEKEDD